MEPVACTLSRKGLQERTATAADLSARGLTASERTPSGYRLRFHPRVERDLEDLIAAELRCCSFMKFDLNQEPGELVLDVSAPEAGRPVIAQLFGLGGGASS